MFQLHDLRKSKVWQETHETGIEKGLEKGKTIARRELARRCQSRSMSAREIGELLDLPLKTVRRFLKATSK
ncbi:MAG: hypothetical protein HYX68_04185 [Planctomycetes bacterium]|nr:hypothetical protein [Planctomycetota bacterium]